MRVVFSGFYLFFCFFLYQKVISRLHFDASDITKSRYGWTKVSFYDFSIAIGCVLDLFLICI